MGLVRELTRDDWGAGPLRSGHVVDERQFGALRVHHTVMVMPDYDRDGFLHGDLDDIVRYMKALQTARPDLGGEVPYSFVMFPGANPYDFIIAWGRGPGVTGAHTRGENSSTYGVVLPGNYEFENPTPGQVAGVRYVGRRYLHNYASAGVTLGHRQVPGESTACPGANTMPLLPLMQPPFTDADLVGVTSSGDDRKRKEREGMIVLANSGPKKGRRWAVLPNGREVEIDQEQASWFIATGELPLDSTKNTAGDSQVKRALASVR